MFHSRTSAGADGPSRCDGSSAHLRCRQLNRALNTIVMWRMNFHPESNAYWLGRHGEGKSDREIRRCLKRHLVRRLFRLLKGIDTLYKHPHRSETILFWKSAAY